MAKTYKIAIFEAGNPADPQKAVMGVYAKDGRQAIAKARRFVQEDCGGKFGPKLSFRVVEDTAEVTPV